MESFLFCQIHLYFGKFLCWFKISELQLLSLSALKVLVYHLLAPSIVKIQVSVFFFFGLAVQLAEI